MDPRRRCSNLTSKPRPALVITSHVFSVVDLVTVDRRNLRQRCGYITPTVLAKVREVVTAYLGFGG